VCPPSAARDPLAGSRTRRRRRLAWPAEEVPAGSALARRFVKKTQKKEMGLRRFPQEDGKLFSYISS